MVVRAAANLIFVLAQAEPLDFLLVIGNEEEKNIGFSTVANLGSAPSIVEAPIRIAIVPDDPRRAYFFFLTRRSSLLRGHNSLR